MKIEYYVEFGERSSDDVMAYQTLFMQLVPPRKGCVGFNPSGTLSASKFLTLKHQY